MPIFNNSSSCIGLDISDLNFKAIQLKKSGKKIKIQAIGKYHLPPGIIEDGEIIKIDEAAKCLKKMLAKPKYGSFSTSNIAACLPETKTFIKLIEIEKGANNIGNLVEPELEKHFPFPVKDAYFDWQIIRETNDVSSVLVGAAPKSVVDSYIAFLQEAKLNIEALEIEAASICRSILEEEAPKPLITEKLNYGIIDVGAKRTSMIIYSHNTIVFTISLPISGDEATKKIAQSLEISKEQAEKAKIICGLDKTKAQGIVSNILSQMTDNINMKISQSLEFFYNHYPELGQINKFIICGGGSNIKNLGQVIGDNFKIPALEGDIFTHIRYVPDKVKNIFKEVYTFDQGIADGSEKLSVEQNASSSFATAMGLALRNYFLKE